MLGQVATAVLAVIPVILQAEDGAVKVFNLLASLLTAEALTEDEVTQIRSDAGIADASYDAEFRLAQARTGG